MGDTEFVIEPGRNDIVIRRDFDAPPEVVFAAMTDPDLIPRWWGPARYEVTVDVSEVRWGGRWRYVTRDGDGTEQAFRGVFHEVAANERVVQTFEYEPVPGHASLETATFEPLEGGRTRFTTVAVYQSVEDRDWMAQSGMEGGVEESYARLDALLRERRTAAPA